MTMQQPRNATTSETTTKFTLKYCTIEVVYSVALVVENNACGMRRHALQGDVDDNLRPVVRATKVRGTTNEALRGKRVTLE